MQIVPVIDLLAGHVVRAERGLRSRYRPISSPLCGSSSPLLVAPILLDYAASDTLYVADLDALAGRGAQVEALAALLAALPGIELWLDAGYRGASAFLALRALLGAGAGRVVPIFGSESLADSAAARASLADRRRAILSLDRRGDAPLDPAGCWDMPECWPERVVVMSLDRVGSFDGPDLALLGEVGRRAPAVSLIGAGGIRDDRDVARAAAAGACAWLTASALHDRRVRPRGG
jgi:phosphoribosylformimino-5-aminoimidazole carboxamide ribotide isomerase